MGQTGLQQVESIVTIVAIVIGAVWAYVLFLRQRTLKPRLEPSISASWGEIDDLSLVSVAVRLTNRGLGKVQMSVADSVATADVTTVTESGCLVEWTALDAFPVLQRHQYLEPSSWVEDTLLIVPPVGADAVRVTARFVAQRRKPFGSVSYETTAIATRGERKEPHDGSGA